MTAGINRCVVVIRGGGLFGEAETFGMFQTNIAEFASLWLHVNGARRTKGGNAEHLAALLRCYSTGEIREYHIP